MTASCTKIMCTIPRGLCHEVLSLLSNLTAGGCRSFRAEGVAGLQINPLLRGHNYTCLLVTVGFNLWFGPHPRRGAQHSFFVLPVHVPLFSFEERSEKMRCVSISPLLALSLLFCECIGSVYKIESSSIGSLNCKVLRNTQTGMFNACRQLH